MDVGLLISPAGRLDLPGICHSIHALRPDTLWSSDSMLRNGAPQLAGQAGMPPRISRGGLLDPFVVLAALATQLDYQPRMGMAVTDFIRRGPADLARCAFTLGQLSGHPFNMGFGVGVPNNVSMVGYPFPTKPVSFLEENLRIFSGINREDQDSAIGRELGYQAEPCDIWIGGHKPRLLGLAARYADGWIPSVKMAPRAYQEKLMDIRQQAAACQRPVPRAALFTALLMGRSKAALYEDIERHPVVKLCALFGHSDAWRAMGHEYPFDVISTGGTGGTGNIVLSQVPAADLARVVVETPAPLVSTAYFIGNADEIADELYPYKAAGVSQLVIPMPNVTEAALGGDSEQVFREYKKLVSIMRGW